MKILLLLISTTIYVALHSQSPPPRPAFLVKDIVPNFEKKCKGSKPIRRTNQQEVSFTFFQDISDTVSIRVNGKEVFRNWVNHDSDLVSSKHTGVFFSYLFPEQNTQVSVCYHLSGIQFEFILNRKYPLYAIYFYSRGDYYVSGRKCRMIIQ